MNKKIKIIDIFNIISKGDYEALPLNIQVDGNKYDTITFLDMIVEVLDDSVEDNTEEIEELEYFNIGKAKSTDQTKMIDKINELVKRIKYIERKINEN